MPAVTRKDDRCTEHDACPPRPSIEGCATVSVAGKPLMHVGHRYGQHGCPDHPAHGAILADGAMHATMAGKRIGRIGDPVSCGGTVMEGCPSVTVGDAGGDDWALEFAKSLVRGEKDELLLCLPEIAAAEAERESGADRQGWLYLREMFDKWFDRPAVTAPEFDPKPFWVDWDWAMSFLRARDEFEKFTTIKLNIYPHNIYNRASRIKLAEILQREGKFTNKRETFDYTKLTWNEWDKWYFTLRSVSPQRIPEIEPSADINSIPRGDGLQAALAGFTLRALAKGVVEPNKDGSHTITVTNVGVYVDDRFAFQRSDNFRYWSCEEKSYRLVNIPWFPDVFQNSDLFFALNGSDFLRFQGKYNIGRDFRVFTQPHAVENFLEMRYDWP